MGGWRRWSEGLVTQLRATRRRSGAGQVTGRGRRPNKGHDNEMMAGWRAEGERMEERAERSRRRCGCSAGDRRGCEVQRRPGVQCS